MSYYSDQEVAADRSRDEARTTLKLARTAILDMLRYDGWKDTFRSKLHDALKHTDYAINEVG